MHSKRSLQHCRRRQCRIHKFLPYAAVLRHAVSQPPAMLVLLGNGHGRERSRLEAHPFLRDGSVTMLTYELCALVAHPAQQG